MKRSELVSKIKEYLSNFENDGFDEELEDDADSLLYMIEKAGMLPPFNSNISQIEYQQTGNGNIWEPENV